MSCQGWARLPLLACLLFAASGLAEPSRRGEISEYGRSPLAFEPNEGQTAPQVRYLARGAGYTLFLTANEAVFRLRGGGVQAESGDRVVRLQWLNADEPARISGEGRQLSTSNYFLGVDQSRWQTGIRHYGRVVYEGVYPGIDLAFYGNQGQLEYDFIVHPGADPSQIRLRFEGVDSVENEKSGNLRLCLGGEAIVQRAPVVYQRSDGQRIPIAGGYEIATAESEIWFALGEYDPTKELVLDPILIFSTFIGGEKLDVAYGVAVDHEFAAYVAGQTFSPDFPLEKAPKTQLGGDNDAFIMKFNASGAALIYSSFFGGSESEMATGVAVDGDTSAYVVGYTDSADFPLTPGAFRWPPQHTPGYEITFVAKVAPDGQSLEYSAWLGESIAGNVARVDVNEAENAFVGTSAGVPTVTAFLTKAGFQNEPQGRLDAYVAKMTPNGTDLVYGTFLGGSDSDHLDDIVVGLGDTAHVTGWTQSTDFPIANGVQPVNAGGLRDAFISKFNPLGSTVTFSTYFGGEHDDRGQGIDVDPEGFIYVAGASDSDELPVPNNCPSCTFADRARAGDRLQDYHFVVKFPPAGGATTYLAEIGELSEFSEAKVAVDQLRRAHVTGYTASLRFPTSPDAFSSGPSGLFDVFLMILNPEGTGFTFSTYFGGSENDRSHDIDVDAFNDSYVTGFTASSGFPVERPFQSTCGGGCSPADGFLFKFGERFTDIAILEVQPQVLLFRAVEEVTPPQSQGIRITNKSIIPLNWTAEVEVLSENTGAWLSVSPAAGVTPTIATVTVDPTGLGRGVLTGSVIIRSSDGQVIVVPVDLTVGADRPVLAVEPAGIRFAAEVTDGVLPAKKVKILNIGTGTLSWRASPVLSDGITEPIAGNDTWLLLAPTEGPVTAGDPANAPEIEVSATTAALEPGRFTQFIRVDAPDLDPPQLQYISVVLDVVEPGSPKPLDIQPGGFLFIAEERLANPPAQQALVYVGSKQEMDFEVNVQNPAGVNFLSASPSSGSASSENLGTIDIRTDITQLVFGEYRGQVDVAFEDGRTLFLPVVLVVTPNPDASPLGRRPSVFQGACVPTKLIVATVGLPGNFQAETGVAQTHTVQVVDDCGNPAEGVSVLATFSSGDQGLPLNALGGRRYSGTWTPQNGADDADLETTASSGGLDGGSASLKGRVAAGAQPSIFPNGVVNAASFLGPIAPGGIISAFGANFADSAFNASQIPLPRELGGVRLRIGDHDAPLFFVNETQINAQAPYELEPGTIVQLYASVNGKATTLVEAPVSEAQPGIFVLNPALGGPNHAVALNQNGSVNTPDNPGAPGTFVTLFLNAIGPLTQPVATGAAALVDPLARAALRTVATIGGRPADVLFLGLTPNFVGLAQASLTIDEQVPAGPQRIKLTIGGNPANQLNLSVGGLAPPPPAAGPDLAVEILDVQPNMAGFGDPVAVNYRVTAAAGVSGAFSRSIRLSSDAVITADDALLDRAAFNLESGAGEFAAMGIPLLRDIDPGPYFVGVIVEDEGDPDPTNNSSAGLAVTVTAVRQPFDLGVTVDGFQPDTIAVGGDLTVTYNVSNFSGATGLYLRQVFLSPDELIEPGSDTLVSQRSFRLDGDSDAITSSGNVIPAVPAGDYWVGVVVEPEGDSDPSDNTSTSTSRLTVTPAAALRGGLMRGPGPRVDVPLVPRAPKADQPVR